MSRLLTRALTAPIRFYKKRLSGSLPPACRFRPSCSIYAMEAIERHGPCKGVLLALWRVLRCNPLAKGGYDPVPPLGKWRPELRFALYSPLGVTGKRKPRSRSDNNL